MKAARIVMFVLCFGVGSAVALTQPMPQPAGSTVPAPGSEVGPVPSGTAQISAQRLNGISLHLSADMERIRAQTLQTQIEMRQTILAVLSPAQRSLVAATIGGLAVAANPDRAAAARVIDGTLSSSQRQAITASVVDAFDRDQAAFVQMATRVNTEMQPSVVQQAQNGTQPLATSQLGSAQVQMHNQVLDSLRNQTTGSIVIAILGGSGPPGALPYLGQLPMMMGPAAPLPLPK